MNTEFTEIGMRILGLREACDVTVEDMAADLGVDVETYRDWEKTGANVPISAIYHMASRFNVEFTEILTGTSAKLDTYQVVRDGMGREVDRFPGYHYDDLAWRFAGKIMQPLLVTLDPSDKPAQLVTHAGQEFNVCTQGRVAVTFDTEEIILEVGDSIYFNSSHPHGQKCAGDKPATFITVIAE